MPTVAIEPHPTQGVCGVAYIQEVHRRTRAYRRTLSRQHLRSRLLQQQGARNQVDLLRPAEIDQTGLRERGVQRRRVVRDTVADRAEVSRGHHTDQPRTRNDRTGRRRLRQHRRTSDHRRPGKHCPPGQLLPAHTRPPVTAK
ncbi:hypothetical protein ACLQ28_18015 [Micromonospora sp. DT201]